MLDITQKTMYFLEIRNYVLNNTSPPALMNKDRGKIWSYLSTHHHFN